jgi:sporulation protein YlmC with PRC-barrel domain
MKPIQRALATCILAVAVGAPVTALAQQASEDPPQGSQLPSMRADDLKGKKVVNDTGDEIGTVDSIVRDKKTHAVDAVVSEGGILGIGGHKVAIPLQDMGTRGNDLLAPAGTTKDKIESMPSYDEANYDKVSGDEKVTVGSTGGSGSGSH